MLIDFTVKNYLSIKEEITLSMLSYNSKKLEGNETKIIPINKHHLVCMAAIYGPNASGKSNIIKAFAEFINLIGKSHKFDLDKNIPAYKPFKLDIATIGSPTSFDMEFLIDSVEYQYLIEFNKKEILKEELYFTPEGRKAKLFVRTSDNVISYGTHYKGDKKRYEKALLPNQLFLSKAANSGHDLLKPIYRYLRDNYNLHIQMDSGAIPLHSTTFHLINSEPEYKDLVMGILNAGDMNIKDIRIDRDNKIFEKINASFGEQASKVPDEFKEIIIQSFVNKVSVGHSIYSNNKEIDELVYFNLETEESSGTIKMYDIAGEIISALKSGHVLLIDEFNSGLHPHLNKFIVNLFLNPEINRKGAQLIISTHDTCVLDIENIGRDQIWFTDKDNYGSTGLFSLDEFDKNKVRANVNFSKWYLDGRFNAIPLLDYNKFKLWDKE